LTKKPINPRRTFSVRGQLVGKLGQQGFGQLLQGLEDAAGGKYRPERPSPTPGPRRPNPRRGGRGRKQVAA
jgi:hypothetical protein